MAYLWSKKVTGDHTQCGSGGILNNFPLAIWRTDADYATVANGGKVQNASGFDRAYFSDAALTSTLFYEHVAGTYNATTGAYEDHVGMGNIVTSTADWVIYSALGDPTVSSDGSSTSTWPGGLSTVAYHGVYHFPNGSSLTVADSSQDGNNLTNHGASALSGQIDGAASFDGSSSYMDVPKGVIPVGSDITLSAWINAQDDTVNDTILGLSNGVDAATCIWFIDAVAGFVPTMYQSGTGRVLQATGPISSSTWTLVHMVYVGHGSVSNKVYYNSVSQSVNNTDNGADFFAYSMTQKLGNGLAFFNGDLDEVRMIHGVLNADWITTEYNNQKSSSTMLSFSGLISHDTDTSWMQATQPSIPFAAYRPTLVNVP